MTLLKYYKTIFLLILVLLLSLLPADTTPKIKLITIPHFDKIVHFFMYFFLSLASFIDIKNNIKKPTRRLFLSVLFYIVTMSGIIEIIQENLIIGRYGSWFDLLANLFGIIFSTIIFYKRAIFVKLHQVH